MESILIACDFAALILLLFGYRKVAKSGAKGANWLFTFKKDKHEKGIPLREKRR